MCVRAFVLRHFLGSLKAKQEATNNFGTPAIFLDTPVYPCRRSESWATQSWANVVSSCFSLFLFVYSTTLSMVAKHFVFLLSPATVNRKLKKTKLAKNSEVAFAVEQACFGFPLKKQGSGPLGRGGAARFVHPELQCKALLQDGNHAGVSLKWNMYHRIQHPPSTNHTYG